MSSKEYDDAMKQLLGAGYNIVKSEYNDSAFGSWFITVNTTPSRRITWEGREKILRVEEETEELLNGSPIWKTLVTTKALQYDEIPISMNEIIGTP